MEDNLHECNIYKGSCILCAAHVRQKALKHVARHSTFPGRLSVHRLHLHAHVFICTLLPARRSDAEKCNVTNYAT